MKIGPLLLKLSIVKIKVAQLFETRGTVYSNPKLSSEQLLNDTSAQMRALSAIKYSQPIS